MARSSMSIARKSKTARVGYGKRVTKDQIDAVKRNVHDLKMSEIKERKRLKEFGKETSETLERIIKAIASMEAEITSLSETKEWRSRRRG